MFKKITIFFLIIIILFATNTSRSTSINSLDSYYYVLALGIDLTENDNLSVTIQIIQNSSSESSSSSAEAPKIYSAEGKTINSCISILNNSLTKKINLSHCSSIIFSEEIIKEHGISSFISDLGNSTEIRDNAYIIISNTTSKEFIENISNTNEEFNSKIYDEFLSSSYDTGYIPECSFGDIFYNTKNESSTSFIPYVINKDGLYQNDGSIVLKKGNFISKLSLEENIYLNLLDNTIESSIITIENPFDSSKFIDLGMKSYKKTKHKTYLVGSSPYIEINIYPEFIIKSSGRNYDYTNENNIEVLENFLNELIILKSSNLLYKLTKELNTDPLNISNIYKMHFLTLDEYQKLNLDKTLKNSYFKINVSTKVKTSNLFNKQ